ncbi:hypothetical protein FRC10_002039 [Ceratobasidium sp. 414]|nr:hypothetical protein FRC10_002039 [Ceratobasidium sp. 414]
MAGSSDKISVPSDQDLAIHNALASTYLGLFRVNVSQISPHPKQRLIDRQWVNRLKEMFQDGVDRAQHPIQAVLDNRDATTELGGVPPTRTIQEVPELPVGFRLYVFDGQHRLEAWKQLAEPAEMFWFAKVYSKALPELHPAEFLTLMHCANELEVKKETLDADRFLAVHELRTLLVKKKITEHQFLSNKHRLEGPNASVQRGVNNLTRNHQLSNAVAAALQHPLIRVHFKASAWRKLTSGHFHSIAASLVNEMAAQCRLIIANDIEVPDTVLGISATLCEVSKIEAKVVKDKKHPWATLSGGPEQALKRVLNGHTGFTSHLKPLLAQQWTFPHLVLLPSVLTSHHVDDALKAMTRIGQHIIHITRSTQTLHEYMSTSPRPKLTDSDLDFGDIIVKSMAHKADLKPGYEHRIIHHMWGNREKLIEELDSKAFPEAKEATRDNYTQLLQSSEPWWNVIHMFKVKRFQEGMQLECSRTFQRPDPGVEDKHSQPPTEPSATAGILEGNQMDQVRKLQVDIQAPPSPPPIERDKASSPPHLVPRKRRKQRAKAISLPVDQVSSTGEEESGSGEEYVQARRPTGHHRREDPVVAGGSSKAQKTRAILSEKLGKVVELQLDLTEEEVVGLHDICSLVLNAKEKGVLPAMLKTVVQTGKASMKRIEKQKAAYYTDEDIDQMTDS